MDQVFVEMLKQAPSLGVLVVLVILFLKHLASEGVANRDAIKDYSATIREHSEVLTQLRIELSSRPSSDPGRPDRPA